MDAPALLSDEPDPRRGLCRAARAVLGADVVVLWERRPDGYAEVTGSSTTLSAGGGMLLPVRATDNVVAEVLHTGVPRVLLDASPEPLGLASLVAHPLMRMGSAAAVVTAGWRRRVRDVDKDALERLGLVLAGGGVTLQAINRAARLERLALTDPLTGLPNRRHLELHLEREVARASRSRRSLAVAVLDLDGLKHINDTEGHDAGDELLRTTTTAWRTRLRTADLLARIGGDEFVLVLPDCGDGPACEEAVERVRRAGAPASAGVAVWDGDEDVAEFLRRADRALYAAKRRGGHRTLVAA